MARQFTQAEFEALSTDQMRDEIMSGATIVEQENAKQDRVDAIEAQNLSNEELIARANAEAGGDEQWVTKQEALELDRQRIAFDHVEHETRNLSPEEIAKLSEVRQAEARIAAADAEAPVKVKAVDQEQRLQDAAFVAGEIEKSNDTVIGAAVDRKIKALQEQARKDQAEIDKSLQAQQDFVNAHPDFVATPNSGNGDALIKFIREELKHTSLTRENLEIAFQTLKARNALFLLNPTQLEAKKQLEHTLATGEAPRTAARRSSTASATRTPSNASWYDSKSEPKTEEDFEAMSPADFAQYGLTHNGSDGRPLIDENAAMRSGVRQVPHDDNRIIDFGRRRF